MLQFGSRFYQFQNVPDGFTEKARTRLQRFQAASERFHVYTLPDGAVELRATLDRDDAHLQGLLLENGVQARRQSSLDFYTGVFGADACISQETARQLAAGHLKALVNRLPG